MSLARQTTSSAGPWQAGRRSHLTGDVGPRILRVVVSALKRGSKRTRYFTSARELDLADMFLGPGWFDVAGDEESAAWNRCGGAFSIRRGEDALLLPWPRLPIGINPPFDLAAEFLARGAAHAAEARVPVLFIVPSATSTDYWAESVWPHATGVCHLNPRPHFAALEDDGSQRSSEHPTSISAVLFGGDLDRFEAVWGVRGPIVRAVRRAERPRVEPQPSLFTSLDMSCGTSHLGA